MGNTDPECSIIGALGKTLPTLTQGLSTEQNLLALILIAGALVFILLKLVFKKKIPMIFNVVLYVGVAMSFISFINIIFFNPTASVNIQVDNELLYPNKNKFSKSYIDNLNSDDNGSKKIFLEKIIKNYKVENNSIIEIHLGEAIDYQNELVRENQELKNNQPVISTDSGGFVSEAAQNYQTGAIE